jgi:hypothetical protein
MPRVEFKPENKNEKYERFPRLKLEKDEQARIVVFENPAAVYVHELRAPKIVNGKASFSMQTSRGGEQVERMDMDFIGRPICLGDLNALDEKGVDPKNCPACLESTQSEAFLPPVRRFSVHIFRYATKPGSFALQSPFSGQVMVWSFSETIFSKLVDFVTEHGPLLHHDLNLGPCTVAMYQKYDINISATAAFKASKETIAFMQQAVAENKCADLDAMSGRKVTRSWMEEDLDKVRARWRIANGVQQDAVQAAEAANLGADLAGLLDSTTTSTKAPASTGAEPPSLDELFAATAAPPVVQQEVPEATPGADTLTDQERFGDPAPTAAQPVEQEKPQPQVVDVLGLGDIEPSVPAAPAVDSAAQDFDALLKQLG